MRMAFGFAPFMWILLVFCAILLLPIIFYLLTLQKALSRCSPESRAMDPGSVWLQVVPFLNLVWHFFIVINVAKSLHAEFARRGLHLLGHLLGDIAGYPEKIALPYIAPVPLPPAPPPPPPYCGSSYLA